MNNRSFIILVFSFIISTFLSCELKMPKEVIPENKMEDILYDYHIAKAMAEEVPYNERYKKAIYVESVFEKHNITQAEFDSSMVWYTRNLEVLGRVYEKMNKRLEKEKESIDFLVAIREDRPLTSEEGDSIDVWAWRKNYKLSSTPLHNKIIFTLPSDSNFYDRDTLVWQATYHFMDIPIVDSVFVYPMMFLQATYDNDSTVLSFSEIKQNGRKELTVYSDTLGVIKEINGFIYIPQNDSLLSEYYVSNISLMRYHAKDSLALDSLTIAPDSIVTDSAKQADILQEELQVDPLDAEETKTEQNQVIQRDPRALRERATQDKVEVEKKVQEPKKNTQPKNQLKKEITEKKNTSILLEAE